MIVALLQLTSSRTQQAGVIDEMMNDMMDSTMDDDVEEETEEEVDKVILRALIGYQSASEVWCRDNDVTHLNLPSHMQHSKC